jgi:hypothetical protein
MEAKNCCAYNVTRSCRINSTVAVADSAREPLKVLKVLVEGLARDSKSSLWLTPLVFAPQLTRIFPFDLAYLDKDMKVLEAIALRPELPVPAFHDGVASALILPFHSLAGSGTVHGDQIIVCPEDELENRLAEISRAGAPETVEPVAPIEAALPEAALPEVTVATDSQPFVALLNRPVNPFPIPSFAVHTLGASGGGGTGFTSGMTTSTWQISKSTMTAGVLERGEIREAPITGPDGVSDAEKKVVDDVGETVLGDKVEVKVLASDHSAQIAGVADDAPYAKVEQRTAKSQPERLDLELVATEPEVPAETLKDVSAEEPQTDVPRVSAESVPAARETTATAKVRQPAVDAPAAKRRKPQADVPAKILAPSTVDPVTTKKTHEEKKRESLGVLVKRFLNCEDPLPERRSIIRLLVQGLIAWTGEGDERKQFEVRDVSPSGLYLRTKTRWRQGAVVSLILQRKGSSEEQCEGRVQVDLRAVRSDQGGMGFEWLWPEGVEFEAWKRVHTKRSDETDADYFLRELRLTRALGFLRRVCPAAMEEMKLALQKRLSNKRVASAVDITLKAQESLGRLAPRAKVHAHPDMVRRILENGSWSEDPWIRQWWAGLLVSSCSAGVPDSSNSVYIDLLAKLTPVHLRVLGFVCRNASERIEAGEPAAKLELYCTSEELVEAVGSHSLARIQQTMGQLSSLGLLADSNKPSYVAVTDKVKTRTTPTALARTMYARCNGRV